MARPCRTPNCPELRPCPDHPDQAWVKQPHHSRGFPAPIKQAIHLRDRWRCQQCGHRDPTGKTLVADHITPITLGGTHTLANGRTLCGACHHTKTAREAAAGRWPHAR